MVDLASRLSRPPDAAVGRPPWPGHEYARGWGVFGLPFDTGHVLALRVFPQSSFGPYRTVWHRTPEGRWSIHVDGPRPDLACPRYYGPACESIGTARIRLAFTGPATLHVTMDRPALDWVLTARATPVLAAMNAVSGVLPLATWRMRALVRAREQAARALGLGDIRMRGRMPSGHEGILMPQRMYYVTDAAAFLDDVDLGGPVRLSRSPRIGTVALPARGILAVGQAAWQIQDPTEHTPSRVDARWDGKSGDR
ncbi:hypothetical protein [Streptomyces sp. NPDC059491]|uniref:hypothetical protein n=1 Tax=Streptomyces sp. NPDC059491 TaxID=3346850 RepID=UPI003683E358